MIGEVDGLQTGVVKRRLALEMSLENVKLDAVGLADDNAEALLLGLYDEVSKGTCNL